MMEYFWSSPYSTTGPGMMSQRPNLEPQSVIYAFAVQILEKMCQISDKPKKNFEYFEAIFVLKV